MRAVVGRHRARDDGARNAARATESLLRGYEDVRHVLILGEKREVQKNLERFGVRREDDKLGDAAVERLGSFVCTLLELLVVLLSRPLFLFFYFFDESESARGAI